MNRTTLLQDCSMQKFRDVFSRWERGDKRSAKADGRFSRHPKGAAILADACVSLRRKPKGLRPAFPLLGQDRSRRNQSMVHGSFGSKLVRGVQPSVQAVADQEVGMRARLDDAGIRDNDDAVGMADRR